MNVLVSAGQRTRSAAEPGERERSVSESPECAGEVEVRDVLPRLARGLHDELDRLGEATLAAQVDGLRVFVPCPCGDKFCQSFQTEEHTPGTPWDGEHHRVPLLPDGEMVNLDVVDGRIVYVEIIV